MENIYNYEINIKVVETAGGEKVVVMNKAIFTAIRNCIYDAAEHRRQQGYDSTADDTMRLWAALCDKNKTSEK